VKCFIFCKSLIVSHIVLIFLTNLIKFKSAFLTLTLMVMLVVIEAMDGEYDDDDDDDDEIDEVLLHFTFVS